MEWRNWRWWTRICLITERDYNFVVTNFERGRFPGSAKFLLQIKQQNQFKFFWNGCCLDEIWLDFSKALTWKLSAFFRSIFQKKVVKITMDWNKVLGAKGRAHIKQKVYTNQSGEEKISTISITSLTTMRNLLVK